ncbi:MAG: hypothetical protein ACRENP_28000 [Longimicrobiales bacterium]
MGPQLGREITNPIRSYTELADYRAARSLAGLAGFNYSVHELTLAQSGGGQRVRGMSVTGSYFNVARRATSAGRHLVSTRTVSRVRAKCHLGPTA